MKDDYVNISWNRHHHPPSFAFKGISGIRRNFFPAVFGAFLVVCLLPFSDWVSTQTAAMAPAASADELAGLWKAKNRFGPDAHGPLIIQKDGSTYVADMMGRRLPVRLEKGELTFDLPDRQGSFRGKLEATNILGHWFRPGTPVNWGGSTWPVALSQVLLKPDGANRWRGNVVPPRTTSLFISCWERSGRTDRWPRCCAIRSLTTALSKGSSASFGTATG